MGGGSLGGRIERVARLGRDTLPPLVAAVQAGKPGIAGRVLKAGTHRFPPAEFGLADALFKKK